MPRPTPPTDPLDRARREVLIGILLAMKRRGLPEGVKPDPNATTESLRATLIAMAQEHRRNAFGGQTPAPFRPILLNQGTEHEHS
ncbi:hypothetical protein L2X99_02875 [Microbacterium sp. KUDC0406]|uniref:hypothetical protein n=1 Tax=Microbacterium sp. KUDC0406 TaxID=2909588 RepID=UPI001F3A5966|nr:hypothetical protein [Microbacterium sp. KUDC0406]UJP10634.1 hypothetical protein L2X99_02875 [Microbacterium sp. KUDC0406]